MAAAGARVASAGQRRAMSGHGSPEEVFQQKEMWLQVSAAAAALVILPFGLLCVYKELTHHEHEHGKNYSHMHIRRKAFPWASTEAATRAGGAGPSRLERGPPPLARPTTKAQATTANPLASAPAASSFPLRRRPPTAPCSTSTARSTGTRSTRAPAPSTTERGELGLSEDRAALMGRDVYM
jgi:hypothetical protein